MMIKMMLVWIVGMLMTVGSTADMPGLNHLLKNFQFEIPEIDQGDLSIKSLICKDISFGNVGLTASSSDDFALDVSGVTAQCDGSLKYGIVTFGFHDISLTLGKTKFDTTIQISKDESGTANAAKSVSCKADVHFDKLKYGVFSAATIANWLTGPIGTSICTSLDGLIDTNLTAVLADVASKLDPEVHPFVPGKPPVAPPNTLDWRKVQIVNTIQHILPLIDVNDLIRKATNGTGIVDKNLGNIRVGNVSTPVVDVIAYLNDIKVYGLDTVDTFLPLAPHEEDEFAHSLNTTLSSKTLGLNVTLTLQMSPGGMVKSPPYNITATAPIVFHDPRAMLDAYIAVNESMLPLPFSELPDPACDLKPMFAFNLTSLQLSLSSVDIAIVGEYADLNLLSEQVIQLFETLYESSALEAFTYFFQSGPLRGMVDEFVAQYIATLDCEGPVPIEFELNKLISTNTKTEASISTNVKSNQEVDINLDCSASADRLNLDFWFEWQNARKWPQGLWSLGMEMLSLQLSQFGLAFLTDTSNDGIPTSVSMGQDSCSATLGLGSVNFAGSEILDTLNRTQEKWIPILDLMGGSVGCLVLGNVVNKTLNTSVSELHDLMTPFLKPPSKIEWTPVTGDGILDWTQSAVLAALDEYLDSNLGPEGLNSLIDKATRGTGNFKITLPSPVVILSKNSSIGSIELYLEEIELQGLNTFQSFDLFRPHNISSLSSTIGLSDFGLKITIMLDASLNPKESAPLIFKESMSIELDVSGMSLNTDAILAVNTSAFSEMYVGQIASDFMCALRPLHTLNITRLDLAFDDVHVNVTGMSSSNLENVVNEALSALDTLYTKSVSEALRNYLAHNGAIMFNTLSTSFLEASHQQSCPIPPQHPAEKLIDWNDSSLIEMFDSLIAMGVPFLNNIVNVLTGGTGDLSLPEISVGPKDFGQFGVLRLDLKSANVTGLNTFDTKDFYIAVPETSNKYALDSRIELGFETPMGLDAEIEFDWKTQDWEFNDDFIVNIDILDLLLNFTSILKIDGAALNAMALSELANKCTLTTIKYLGFDTNTSSISLGNFSIHGKCVSCTGDMPEDSQHHFDNLPEMINNTLREFDRAVFSIVENLANDQLTKLSYDCGTPSPTPTPGPHSGSKSDFSWFFDNPGPFAVLISLLIILVLAVAWCSYRRHMYNKRKARKRQETVMSASRDVDELLEEYESGIEEEENKREDIQDQEPLLSEKAFDETYRYDCLAFESCVPVYARYGVPIVIVGTMAMLVNANISLGAAVTAYLTLLDQTEKIPNLFEFTLKSSIQEMWNAGVYPLSILIAVASGGWPYLKLALCLIVWLLPRRMLDLQGRNRFLNILEQTGKWSLIDTYVLVMMCVSFHFQLNQFDPYGGADVVVEPGWGFYGFLLATMISMSLSHFMTYYHRLATGQYALLDADTRRMALRSHKFLTRNPDKKKRGKNDDGHEPRVVTCTPSGQICVVFMLFVALALLVAGSFATSFSFHFMGAIDIALPEEQVTADYSLISLGVKLPSTQIDQNGFGIRVLQAVFYLFAFGFPIMQLVCLFILWQIPLTLKHQFVVFVIMEVSSAWNSLDVFIVSVIAALVEIRQFASFIVGSKCDFLQPILDKDIDYLLDEKKCFDVETVLLEGCWLLFASCFICYAVGFVISHMCEHAMLARMKQSSSSSSSSDMKSHQDAADPHHRLSLLNASPTGGLSSGIISDAIRPGTPSGSPSSSRRPRKVSMLVDVLRDMSLVTVEDPPGLSLGEPLLGDHNDEEAGVVRALSNA